MSRCIPLKDTCNLHPTTPGSESIPKFATGFERHVATAYWHRGVPPCSPARGVKSPSERVYSVLVLTEGFDRGVRSCSFTFETGCGERGGPRRN